MGQNNQRNKMQVFLAWPLIVLVKGYRRFISPLIPPRCKYYPTCSTYALECLKRHGPIKGVLLSSWRLLRCNPFSLGGVDYPPNKGKWRRPSYRQMTDQELAEHWARLEETCSKAASLDSSSEIKAE